MKAKVDQKMGVTQSVSQNMYFSSETSAAIPASSRHSNLHSFSPASVVVFQ